MNSRLPLRTVVAVTAFFAVSLALFAFFMIRLGALPSPGVRTRSVEAVFANAEGLPAQADVLVHGVKVGTVSAIQVRAAGTTRVTLALSSGTPALHADASAAVGFKTPLGEPFVDLDPGHAAARLRSGVIASRSTVEIDDALGFLDAPGRANLRSALLTLGQGTAAPQASQQLNGTIAALAQSTESVGRLLGELRGQRSQLSGLVSNGRVVLDALSARAAELSSLTGDARTTAAALALQRSSLQRVIDRLPGLLGAARGTLYDSEPLIAQATPLAGELQAAAPSLTSALRALPATVSGFEQVLGSAGALRSSVIPALAELRALGGPAATGLRLLGPALADVVPVAQYLGPRGRTIAAWFANTADLGSHGDAKGDWARFFVMFDPATLTGTKLGGAPRGNSYTGPGDAADNRAYASGGYQRLEPYAPALGRGR
jgi:phospholipid/cholesterol/gamma-HCH transport system substrate-binding protein